MTEFRQAPGERIIDVVRDHISFLLTKSGKPVAKLVPVDETVRQQESNVVDEVILTRREAAALDMAAVDSLLLAARLTRDEIAAVRRKLRSD